MNNTDYSHGTSAREQRVVTAGVQLTLSEPARRELLRLTDAEGSFLRVWVERGGCSGMVYQAAIDEKPGPFDLPVYDDGTLQIVTDAGSRAYVEGMQIHYSDDLVRAGFRFANPRVNHSCGCGQSFRE
jgi:iron-sulfur cluster assembly protein